MQQCPHITKHLFIDIVAHRIVGKTVISITSCLKPSFLLFTKFNTPICFTVLIRLSESFANNMFFYLLMEIDVSSVHMCVCKNPNLNSASLKIFSIFYFLSPFLSLYLICFLMREYKSTFECENKKKIVLP